MTISIVNVAKYYQGLSHQDEAIAYLEKELLRTNPELLAPDSDFVQIWRNPDEPPPSIYPFRIFRNSTMSTTPTDLVTSPVLQCVWLISDVRW